MVTTRKLVSGNVRATVDQHIEVAVRIGPNRHDVDVRLPAGRPECLDVHPERHELDADIDAVFGRPIPEHLGLAVAVGEHRGCLSQRRRVQPLHPWGREPGEPLG